MSGSRPFSELPPVPPTWWQRLSRRAPRENAFIEINNLLARAASIRAVDPAVVPHICREHHADLYGPLAGRLERLYRDYLMYCLEDRQLSQDEVDDLRHLQLVLRIGNETARAIQENVARQVYSQSVAEVLSDGVIDADERAFLTLLQRELALPSREAGRIERGRSR